MNLACLRGFELCLDVIWLCHEWLPPQRSYMRLIDGQGSYCVECLGRLRRYRVERLLGLIGLYIKGLTRLKAFT